MVMDLERQWFIRRIVNVINKDMKATENQIDACETLKICLASWQDSNDITSPSHFNLIETIIQTEMMDNADDELKEEIIEKMQDLYRLIRKIK